MAKLNTYKFVNPGASKTKDSEVVAVRKAVLATNRIGDTVNGISLIVKDLNLVQIAKEKQDDKQEQFERREERRKLDAEAEEKQEVGKVKPKKQNIKITSKEKKGAKKAFGWLEKFLSPITNLILSFGKAVLAPMLLKWMSDPENREKLTVFVDKTLFVVGKLFDFAAFLTTSLLDGLGALFGEDSTFFERVEGLGKVLMGIIGLKYLMNPFSLITDILGLLNFIGDGPDGRTKPKGQNAADEIADAATEAAKKGSKKRAAQVTAELGEAAGKRYAENTKKFGADYAEEVFERAKRTKGVFKKFGPEAASSYKKVLAQHGEEAGKIFLQGLENGKDVKAANAAVDRLIKSGKLPSNPLTQPPPKKPGIFGRLRSGFEDFGKFIVEDLPGDIRKRADDAGEFLLKGVKSFPSAVQNGFEWAGAQYNALSEGARKRWQQVVAAGNAVKERGSKLLTAAGDRFNKLKAGATEFVIKNFLKPIEPFIKPVQETFVKIGTSISENLNKIPGYKYVTEFLGKRGITVANALTSAAKFGDRAATIIPVIGGIANLIFAYDKAANGDAIGAIIEGTAGVLDIASVFAGPAAPVVGGIALGLDLYSLARDFVPQIQEGENKVFETLGLSGAINQVNSVLSKMPNLGELWGLITGSKLGEATPDKPEEKAVGGTLDSSVSSIYNNTVRVQGLPYMASGGALSTYTPETLNRYEKQLEAASIVGKDPNTGETVEAIQKKIIQHKRIMNILQSKSAESSTSTPVESLNPTRTPNIPSPITPQAVTPPSINTNLPRRNDTRLTDFTRMIPERLRGIIAPNIMQQGQRLMGGAANSVSPQTTTTEINLSSSMSSQPVQSSTPPANNIAPVKSSTPPANNIAPVKSLSATLARENNAVQTALMSPVQGGGSTTLDPTKTAASNPEVFAAARQARAAARAEGLPREEVERRVVAASEAALKRQQGAPAAQISPAAQPESATMLGPTSGTSAEYTMQKQTKKAGVVPMPIPKLVPVGGQAPINSGGGGASYSAPNPIITRLK